MIDIESQQEHELQVKPCSTCKCVCYIISCVITVIIILRILFIYNIIH